MHENYFRSLLYKDGQNNFILATNYSMKNIGFGDSLGRNTSTTTNTCVSEGTQSPGTQARAQARACCLPPFSRILMSFTDSFSDSAATSLLIKSPMKNYNARN